MSAQHLQVTQVAVDRGGGRVFNPGDNRFHEGSHGGNIVSWDTRGFRRTYGAPRNAPKVDTKPATSRAYRSVLVLDPPGRGQSREGQTMAAPAARVQGEIKQRDPATDGEGACASNAGDDEDDEVVGAGIASVGYQSAIRKNRRHPHVLARNIWYDAKRGQPAKVPEPGPLDEPLCDKDTLSRRQKCKFHLPGYLAFVPRETFSFGKTFGNTSRESLSTFWKSKSHHFSEERLQTLF